MVTQGDLSRSRYRPAADKSGRGGRVVRGPVGWTAPCRQIEFEAGD